MVYQVKSKADFEAKLAEAGDKLVLIDFMATWCGPCKRIAPLLERLAEEYESKMVVLKVDVDENEDLVNEYSVEVMPTFVFRRQNVHLDTLSGSNEEKLKELVKKNISAN